LTPSCFRTATVLEEPIFLPAGRAPPSRSVEYSEISMSPEVQCAAVRMVLLERMTPVHRYSLTSKPVLTVLTIPTVEKGILFETGIPV